MLGERASAATAAPGEVKHRQLHQSRLENGCKNQLLVSATLTQVLESIGPVQVQVEVHLGFGQANVVGLCNFNMLQLVLVKL